MLGLRLLTALRQRKLIKQSTCFYFFYVHATIQFPILDLSFLNLFLLFFLVPFVTFLVEIEELEK